MESFDGQVLTGARASTSNADTTGEVSSGVSRAVTTSTTPAYPSATVVDINGARYRATLLENGQTVEYLLWANSSGPLAVVPGTVSSDGVIAIPTGTLTVNDLSVPTSGVRTDGTQRVVLTDNGGAYIASVVSVAYVRGGTLTKVTFTTPDFDFDPTSGTLKLNDTATVRGAVDVPTTDPVAVSASRGDYFTDLQYEVSPATFNWTRNDPTGTRFGWNGAHRKWEPYKGGATKNLDRLSASASKRYVLSPVPTLPVGSTLPGDTGTQYAMLRLGPTPSEASYPVVPDGTYNGVRVVTDDVANASYDFDVTSPPLAGVMGQNSGKVVWNPVFVADHEGDFLWYSPRDFTALSKGVVGSVLDDLFISPVPSPLERPILRIGNRAPLTVISVPTEADLNTLTVNSGEVGVALTTGKIKLNSGDIAKANPTDPAFDPLYLGATLHYDGVALNRYPQPVQASVACTVSGFDRVIPAAALLPGTGVSGMIRVPDGTGNAPNPTLTPISPRPVASGLVERLNPGFGDAFLFTTAGRIPKIVTVNFDADLPTNIFAMPSDTAYVSLDTGLVRVGYSLGQTLVGKTVYFVQALVTPALYPDGNRLLSRVRDTFTFAGTETFTFAIDGVTYNYTPSAGTRTAAQVATALATVVGGGGSVGVQNGYLYIASLHGGASGSVSIGFNEAGCRALGFPPGWRVSNPVANPPNTDGNWLPDTGLSYGLSRSPNNLDGSQSAPDVRATYRVEEASLSESLQPVPYQLLDYPPREDIAGYDVGQFFALSGVASPTTVKIRTVLQPWTDVVYQFDQSRFGWLSPFSFAGQVLSPVSSIDLGNAGVVPETFYTAMHGSLKVSSKGGSAQSLTLNTDFLVPPGSGTALLIERIGPEVLKGYRGSVTGSVLTDASVSFTGIAQVGDRLKITSGDSTGSYIVASSTATTLTVVNPFPVASTGNVSWELYRGVDYTDPAKVDPSVLADAVYTDFNHLGDEPFKVRLYTPLGTAGGTLATVDLPTANSGRVLTARFGTTGLITSQLTVLTSTVLGAIANGALFVPTTNPRFSTGKFSVVVGTKVFVNGTDLLPVASFSPDPGTNIEYLTTTGELKFGTSVFADYGSATVVYREEVLAPANVLQGTGELSPFTGEVALNATDITSNSGKTVYLVDLQTYEQVYLNPILGAFTFRRPMQAGQLVEATYTRAKPDSGLPYPNATTPEVVTEFLPVFIRRESAVRVNQQDYTFNGAGRTLDTDVAPSVFVGANLVSYGVPIGVHFKFDQNTFSLVKPVIDPATRVLISYAVYEASGGETSYTVSKGPVWRPPFRLTANVSFFYLKGNRASEFAAGQILRLGNFLTYLKGTTYDAPTNLTKVEIFPAPTRDVGSLAPSDPPINSVTDRPVTPLVNGVTTAAENGLLPKLTDAYGLAAVPAFQTVTKGQNVVRFDGDLTKYAVTGHVIELFGRPYLIAKSELIDGKYTDITLGTPSPIEMVWTPTLDTGSVRITPRPLYPVDATVFIGAGAFVPTEPYEVVLYEGTAPGVTLVESRDYQLDPAAGTLSLLQPRQPGLPASSSLRFYRTAQENLAPFVSQGTLQYPRVSASAGFIDPPSETNGRLGAVLTATYTFDSPDSFYARSLPLPAYITETSRSIVQGVTRNASGTNPSVGSYPKNSPSTKGTAGLTSERQDLVSRDRVTRTFLRYFNGVITSFEQVLENIDGNPIGDRDGKFRMWMGTGDPWTPPGYEDGITGAINPRNVWNDVWNGFRTNPIALIPSDPVLNPITATTDVNGNPVGASLNSGALGKLQSLQYRAIKNDVDDVVLTGLTGTTLSFTGFIRFAVTSYGVFRDLSEPSAFSRLYPERTHAFTTTDPGIGYDPTTGSVGVYSYGKLELDLFGDPPSIDIQSTNGKPIARLENPVRGRITSALGATVQNRYARARLVAYYPNGVSGVTTSPVFLATVLPLDQFPLLPDGSPDTAKLYSNALGGTLHDLKTGDPELHTPPFAPGQQLSFGTPDGTTYGLGYSGTTVPVNGNPVFPGVFVDSIIQSCYVTVKSYSAANTFVSITDPATLLKLTSPNTGTALTAELGDTLFVVPSTGVFNAIASPPAAALTPTQLQTFTASLPAYRTGFDVDLDGRGGQLVDATLPSWSDPFIFGIKEITGQRPPDPVTNLEAVVTFQNGDTSPSNIPALRGQSRLDSGDYSLPYYQIGPTELDVLGRVFPVGIAVIGAQSPSPVVDNPAPPGYPAYTVEAVYPDEVLDNGGTVAPTDPTYPAALRGTMVLNPTYLPHTGVGTVQPYDLVYVQKGTGGTLNPGATGIRTVGAVDYTDKVIEPPRFVTQTNILGKTSVEVKNIQAWMDASHTTGMEVTEDQSVPGVVITTFRLLGVPTTEIVFNDGGGAVAPPVGGFNTYFTLGDKPNLFRLKVIGKITNNFKPGANVVLVLTSQNPDITLCSFNVSGDNGVTFVGGFAKWEQQKLVVQTPVPFFNFAAYGVVPTPPVTTMSLFDFAIDVDSGTLSSGGTQSMFIAGDRLTFVGPIDTRTARPRGTTTPGGDNIECRLNTRGEECLLVDSIAGPFSKFSKVNSVEFTNDKEAFTFLPRSYIPSTYQVGAFGFGIGLLKVMAYEGWQNTELTSSEPITYSAAPSSRQGETGAILATATVSDRVDNPPYTPGLGGTYKPRWGENRFLLDPAGVLKGSMSKVLPGDVVVAQAVSLDPAFLAPIGTTKAGTHLVRAVMVPTVGIEECRETLAVPDTNGDYHGWLDFDFPTLTAKNLGSLVIQVSNIQALPPLTGWLDTPAPYPYVFPPSGRVFVIVNEAGLNSTLAATFAASVVSADYTSFNAGTGKFDIAPGTAQNGAGAALTDVAFFNAITVGSKVSGFYVLPMNPRSDAIPANLPGYTSVTGTQAVFGVRQLRVSRPSSVSTFTWNASGGELLPTVLTDPNLNVYQKVLVSSAVFQPLTEPVYNEIPGAIDIQMSNASWDALHLPSGGVFSTAGARCFLPGDRWAVDYSGAAGIYVEPSFPTTANNMTSGKVNVVDAVNGSIPVGVRRLKDYITAPALGHFQVEFTEIEVRRPRRFHALGNEFGAALATLRYSYEIRRGIVGSVVASGGYSTLTALPVNGEVPPTVTGGTSATQLGDFTNKLVNVNPGDEVRFINTSGNVYARAEVVKVTGALTLKLSRRVTVSPNDRFEVYLKVPPVPHEQSNEELLGYATDKVLLNRSVDYTAATGGKVTTTNVLTDTGVDFTTLDLQKGDLLLVDPAGLVRGPTGPAVPQQRGRRPYGDDSVPARLAPTYSAGSPVVADDNRGYYKIVTSPAPTAHTVTVQAIGGLAGNTGGDVVFGTAGNQYAVYPTIHGSLAPSGAVEGQMDLRVTAPANGGTNKFTGYRSIEPFSYRVIRPTKLLSEETVELILAMRERMLSWMEEVRTVQFKYGTYFVFQRDRHISDLGLTTDPESGLGLLTNPYLFGIVGNWTEAPFANVRDCLSILDRRFWCLDYRLDTLTPPYGISATHYASLSTGVGRPVLVDRINEALDGRDNLRFTRYSWLTLRVNRVSGTLEGIRRFDAELPKRRAEAEQALAAVQSVEKV